MERILKTQNRICRERRLDNGCIEWTGFRDKWGYGRVKRAGKCMFAHRASWEEHRGAIPAGMFVCHSCDNRACINPEHLFLGTALDNVKDMDAKGRCPRAPGEVNGRAKVNAETVRRIRALKGVMTGVEIAPMVGLSKTQVYNILGGKQWRQT